MAKRALTPANRAIASRPISPRRTRLRGTTIGDWSATTSVRSVVRRGRRRALPMPPCSGPRSRREQLGRWDAAVEPEAAGLCADPRSSVTALVLAAPFAPAAFPEALEAASRAGTLGPNNVQAIQVKVMSIWARVTSRVRGASSGIRRPASSRPWSSPIWRRSRALLGPAPSSRISCSGFLQRVRIETIAGTGPGPGRSLLAEGRPGALRGLRDSATVAVDTSAQDALPVTTARAHVLARGHT